MINDGNEMADSCLTHHTLTQAFSQISVLNQDLNSYRQEYNISNGHTHVLVYVLIYDKQNHCLNILTSVKIF